MHHLIYLSWASTPFSEQQLQDLLRQARRHNSEVGITGFLFYGKERFMQVLEGEEATVQALYELIKRDARHQNVLCFANKPIEQRAFGEWAMAFQTGTPQQVEQLAGYLGPTSVALDLANLPMADIHLIDLLRSFTLS